MTRDISIIPAVPDVGRADAAIAGWHALLHERLANQPTPVVLFSDSVRSAASLWAGMRAWISTFRAVGIGCGDHVVSVLPAGDALMQLTLACLWESVGLVLAAAVVKGPLDTVDVDVDALLARHDARCVVGIGVAGTHVLEPAAGGWPATLTDGWRVRATIGPGGPAAPGIADAACADPFPFAACLESARRHHAHGLFAHARILTLCDWQQRAGLWGGVIQPLLEAEELFVPTDRTDVAAVQRLLAEEPVTHVLVDRGVSAAVLAVLIAHGVPIVTVPDGLG